MVHFSDRDLNSFKALTLDRGTNPNAEIRCQRKRSEILQEHPQEFGWWIEQTFGGRRSARRRKEMGMPQKAQKRN
jgi:hypothetical protein